MPPEIIPPLDVAPRVKEIFNVPVEYAIDVSTDLLHNRNVVFTVMTIPVAQLELMAVLVAFRMEMEFVFVQPRRNAGSCNNNNQCYGNNNGCTTCSSSGQCV